MSQHEEHLASLTKPDVWLAVKSGVDSSYYVNGYKVLNSQAPLRQWIRSRKPSKGWLSFKNKPQAAFLIPHTADAAVRLLRHMHAALVLLDHQNPHRWPCPFGVVWVRTGDELFNGSYCKQSVEFQWGMEIVAESSRRKHAFFGFLGDNFYQDGHKFKHAAERAAQWTAPVVVAVKDVWLKELAERLNAFAQFKRDEKNKRASYL